MSDRRLEFTVPAIALSKKNGQQILRSHRRRGSYVEASERSQAVEGLIQLCAQRAVPREVLRAGTALFGDHYVAVSIGIDEATDSMRIEVVDLGAQPARGPRRTRRDVHNVADSVMDAMQGIVFADDRQARRVVTYHTGFEERQ